MDDLGLTANYRSGNYLLIVYSKVNKCVVCTNRYVGSVRVGAPLWWRGREREGEGREREREGGDHERERGREREGERESE